MTKTEYVLSLIQNVEAQAANRAPGNALIESLGPLKTRMKQKKGLGLSPNAEKAPALIASIKASIAAHNAAVQVTAPSDEEILAGLAEAEDDTPTEL